MKAFDDFLTNSVHALAYTHGRYTDGTLRLVALCGVNRGEKFTALVAEFGPTYDVPECSDCRKRLSGGNGDESK